MKKTLTRCLSENVARSGTCAASTYLRGREANSAHRVAAGVQAGELGLLEGGGHGEGLLGVHGHHLGAARGREAPGMGAGLRLPSALPERAVFGGRAPPAPAPPALPHSSYTLPARTGRARVMRPQDGQGTGGETPGAPARPSGAPARPSGPAPPPSAPARARGRTRRGGVRLPRGAGSDSRSPGHSRSNPALPSAAGPAGRGEERAFLRGQNPRADVWSRGAVVHTATPGERL